MSFVTEFRYGATAQALHHDARTHEYTAHNSSCGLHYSPQKKRQSRPRHRDRLREPEQNSYLIGYVNRNRTVTLYTKHEEEKEKRNRGEGEEDYGNDDDDGDKVEEDENEEKMKKTLTLNMIINRNKLT